MTIFRSNCSSSSHAVKCIVVFPPPLLLFFVLFPGRWCNGIQDDPLSQSSAAFSPPFVSNIHLVCHPKFRATFSQIQAQEKINDREEIFERILQLFFELFLHNSSFPLASHSMSLNIDMKMILSLNSAGSHCNSPIIF